MLASAARRILPTTLVLAACVLAGPSAAGAATPGALSQLTGTDGCLSTTGNGFGCAAGSAVKESTSVVVSPDGKNVYVAATDSSGVEVLSRNTSTGAVTQLPGTNGCITATGADDNGTAGACATANGLAGGPDYITISPDGHNVYVTDGNDSTLLSFARDSSTGTLTQTQCLGEDTPPTGCTAETGALLSDAHAVIVSADGAHVYTVAGENSGVTGAPPGGVMLYNRDATGALSQPSGDAKCVTVDGKDNNATAAACRVARDLSEPYHLVLSPDGHQLYVASSDGDPITSDGAVVRLDVQGDGSLVQPSGPAGCLDRSGTGDNSDATACAAGKPAHDLNGIAISPDGKSVYGAAAGDGGTSTPGAIEIMSRDPATGNLSQDTATTAGCLSVNGTDGDHAIANTCTTARAIGETYRITVSPDGAVVYAASQGVGASNPGAVAVFSRSSGGALTQLSGTEGCISDSSGTDGTGGTTCAAGRALGGAYQLAQSSDCTSSYVASQNAPGLAVFSGHPCLAPLATTTAASSVGTSSATLNGSVNPQGTDASVHFDYGTSTSYGSSTPAQDAGSGTSAGPVSAGLTGLSPGTTYHFRVVATNAYGTSAGSDQSFTTAPAPQGSTPPKLTMLTESRRCVRSVALRGAPLTGAGGLSFSYTLDQDASVEFVLKRLDGSPRWTRCPGVHGHSHTVYKQVGRLVGQGHAGNNTHSLATTARARRARALAIVRALRHGRHSIRLADIAGGHQLTPGTYVLFVTATNAAGQRSTTLTIKFWILR